MLLAGPDRYRLPALQVRAESLDIAHPQHLDIASNRTSGSGSRKKHSHLATGTASRSVTVIGTGTLGRRIALMPDGKTDRAVLDFLLRELPRYGVHPFEARKESAGFVFNRIWAAIKRESPAAVAEGVSTPGDMDRMWAIDTGLKAGPFRMMDGVGPDVVLDIENHYAAENPTCPRVRVSCCVAMWTPGTWG